MCANTRIQTDTIDDSLWVETLHLSVCVQFVEVADTQSEIGVGKEFHCLCLFHAHKERVDIFLDGSFPKQIGKGLGIFLGIGIANGLNGGILFVELFSINKFRITNYDAAGIEIIIESLAFTQELWRE